MPLYYITGISGSGKSAALQELRSRGYEAHGTDEDGLAFFQNNETGKPITYDATAEHRTPEWRDMHTWKLSRSAVEKLQESAKDKPVFLCGVVSNDADELWDLFAKVFALNIDERTLRHRIANRTNNDFGKNRHEFDSLLSWQKTAEEDYLRLGAVIIDANRPINVVANDILSRLAF